MKQVPPTITSTIIGDGEDDSEYFICDSFFSQVMYLPFTIDTLTDEQISNNINSMRQSKSPMIEALGLPLVHHFELDKLKKKGKHVLSRNIQKVLN